MSLRNGILALVFVLPTCAHGIEMCHLTGQIVLHEAETINCPSPKSMTADDGTEIITNGNSLTLDAENHIVIGTGDKGLMIRSFLAGSDTDAARIVINANTVTGRLVIENDGAAPGAGGDIVLNSLTYSDFQPTLSAKGAGGSRDGRIEVLANGHEVPLAEAHQRL